MIKMTSRFRQSAAALAAVFVLPLAGAPVAALAATIPTPATQSTQDVTTDPVSPTATTGASTAASPGHVVRQHPVVRAAAKHDASPETVEQRITDLHARLKITPAQQPQWDDFANVMRSNAQAMTASFKTRATQVSAMNAADNMQSFAQLAQDHAQQLQTLSASFGKLYATFSDEQKKLADDTFRNVAARHG